MFVPPRRTSNLSFQGLSSGRDGFLPLFACAATSFGTFGSSAALLAQMIGRYVVAQKQAEDDPRSRLYSRAMNILEGRANGHALPILRALSVRQFAPAKNVLSDYRSPREALALLRRAASKGDQVARYNLAIEHRNRGDLRSYRYWLGYAARLDPEAKAELRQFRRRFPEAIMKQHGMFARSRRT